MFMSCPSLMTLRRGDRYANPLHLRSNLWTTPAVGHVAAVEPDMKARQQECGAVVVYRRVQRPVSYASRDTH